MKISFHLHVNQNYFSYERMSTKTRFEKEAKGNSEMVYSQTVRLIGHCFTTRMSRTSRTGRGLVYTS